MSVVGRKKWYLKNCEVGRLSNCKGQMTQRQSGNIELLYMYSKAAETVLLRKKVTIMNPQIQSEKEFDKVNTANIAITETDTLTENGFTSEEIVSLLYLRQWYQTGGSDRVEVVRRLEFLKLMVMNGTIEPQLLFLHDRFNGTKTET